MRLTIKEITVFILTSGLLVFGCKPEKEQSSPSKPKKMPLVKVQAAVKTRMVSSIEITGTLQANVFTDIKSPADGIIESLMARENQMVEKDRIIAEINPEERVALISKGRFQVQQIKEKLKTAEAYSDDLSSLKQELEKAEKNLDYATKMYQTIPVVCPMNGLVTRRFTDIGSQIGVKEKMLTVTDMSSLVIKAQVNEKYFEAVKQGRRLTVILSAYPLDTLTGFISLVYPQVDPVTRSVRFDIKIRNFHKRLIPGMMAAIEIPVSVKEDAIVAPEHAVLTPTDKSCFLFVINNDSIALRRMVQTGISSGNNLEITKGLKENEKIVVSGQEMLKDGMRVKIMGTPKKGRK